MEAKHTAGPWELRVNGMGGLDSLIYPQGKDHPVAAITGYYTNAGQMLPNARLIATAPELLEDLREAAMTLRRYETLHRAKGTSESDAKAEVNAGLAARFEATIRKATQ